MQLSVAGVSCSVLLKPAFAVHEAPLLQLLHHAPQGWVEPTCRRAQLPHQVKQFRRLGDRQVELVQQRPTATLELLAINQEFKSIAVNFPIQVDEIAVLVDVYEQSFLSMEIRVRCCRNSHQFKHLENPIRRSCPWN